MYQELLKTLEKEPMSMPDLEREGFGQEQLNHLNLPQETRGKSLSCLQTVHDAITKLDEKTNSQFRLKLALALTAVGLVGAGVAVAYSANRDLRPPTTAAHAATLPDSFQTSDKALDEFLSRKNLSYDPCTDYVKIAGDTYGPEIDRACREQSPLEIRAIDYIKDSSGNVTNQRMVINNNELWESAADSVTHAFSDYKFVSKSSMENVTSMISSLDGVIVLKGGEKIIRNGPMSLDVSFDGDKTVNNITLSYPDPVPLVDLIRFTDNIFLGNPGNYEGGTGQFIITVDPKTKTVSTQPITPNIGSANGLRVASLDTANNRVQMVSTGSFNLRTGLVLMDMDYTTGIGTANNITKTLISGVPVYLNYLYGSGFYTDELGHLHVKTSDPYNQLLYDIDTTNNPSTAISGYYGSTFNNKDISNYMADSLRIFTVDVFTNTLGSRETRVGGGYASVLDGGSRAFFGDLDKNLIYDLEPNIISGIAPKGMQRLIINNQTGSGLNILNLGQAFILDEGVPIYTDRLAIKPPPPSFKIYIPLVIK